MEVGAEHLFKTFVALYGRVQGKHGTPLWLYHKKLSMADVLKSSDWTPVMMTFLDYLAWKLRYLQLYERPLTGRSRAKRDGIWVRPKDPTTRVVVIEAENRPLTVFGSEVPKLLEDDAPTKILVTEHAYKEDESPEGWRQSYIDRLNKEIRSLHEIRPRDRANFILILADNVIPDPSDWYGFLWSWRDGRWRDGYVSLPRR